jgi:hypothetical protein
VATAALQIGHIAYAATLIRAVTSAFPDSMRANRLKVRTQGCAATAGACTGNTPRLVQGMYWEAQGQSEHLAQAEQLYKDMIAEQPSCTMAFKRLVWTSAADALLQIAR